MTCEGKVSLEVGEPADEAKKDEKAGGFASRISSQLFDKFYESAVSQIPNDRLRATNDRRLVVTFGVAMNVASLFVFAYFIATTYLSSQNAPYLAIERDGGNCNYVPKTISGTWTHSYNGLWSNQYGYNPSYGYISFTLSSLAVDTAGFKDLIQTFQKKFLDLWGCILPVGEGQGQGDRRGDIVGGDRDRPLECGAKHAIIKNN